MHTITATELARHLRQVLDRLAAGGEEILVERNHQPIARLLSMPPRQSAMEVMADLYRTLPEGAARGWIEDAQRVDVDLDREMRDPWAT